MSRLSKQTLTSIISLLKSVDFGRGSEEDLALLEDVHDILTSSGIHSEDLDQALSIFLTDPEKSRTYIYGPTHRGTNQGLLNDLIALHSPTLVAYAGGIYSIR